MLQTMTNIFDYSEYESKCKEYKVPINSLQQYCIGVGALMVGRANYPHLDWQESYSQTFKDMNAGQPEGEGCCDEKEDHLTKKSVSQLDEKPVSLYEAGKSLLKATTEHISKGLSQVSNKEYIRRLNICNSCTVIKEGFVCGKCRCPMGTKAHWDITDICRLNKW